MKNHFDKKLVVFELANNHMGFVDHGIKIINTYGKLIKNYRSKFDFAFKLQYRHLSSFIHKDFKKRKDLHYVKRFMETKLSINDFNKLIATIKKNKFKAISTPFDEPSVQLIEKQKLDFIKIASCSFNDWPLLEAVAKVNKPIILSTAGTTKKDIDEVVSFLANRNKNFALLHCVAEYPTPTNKLHLNQIDFLKNRYENIPIGYSSHEFPNNFENVKIAVAKGVQIFEKHVGIVSEAFKLNKYSLSPHQTKLWLESLSQAVEICGNIIRERTININEQKSLRSLQRGVYLKKNVKKNQKINLNDVYFSFPPQKNQILANEFSKYLTLIAKNKINKDKPLLKKIVKVKNNRNLIYDIINKISDFVKKANINLPKKINIELSYHYGLDKFYKYGLSMFTIVNREYCKKILVSLPKQIHPAQYHKKKEETFNVIYGNVDLVLDGKKKYLYPGDVVTIKPGQVHQFSSKKGSVIEEISTTHHKSDSYYIDESINQNKNRKTVVNFWM